jgi:hypothetical protein
MNERIINSGDVTPDKAKRQKHWRRPAKMSPELIDPATGLPTLYTKDGMLDSPISEVAVHIGMDARFLDELARKGRFSSVVTLGRLRPMNPTEAETYLRTRRPGSGRPPKNPVASSILRLHPFSTGNLRTIGVL